MTSSDLFKLDLRGLKCPMPALRTRKFLERLPPGSQIEVTCTDPMASIDIPHLINQTGHRLEATSARDGEISFLITRGDTP